jgi:cytochrome c oxidase cbb3-type subunit 3
MSTDTETKTEDTGSAPGEPKLLAHSYDGIQEFDNPLPGWWKFLFVAGFVFMPIYVAIYHGGTSTPSADEYRADAAELGAIKAKRALGEAVSNESLAALKGDPTAMKAAAETFATKCAMCHGPEGQGTIGPNLTDEYWIHGGALVDIYKTIDKGVPAKGMIAWGGQFQPAQLRGMTAYVQTLVGTNPSNPKAPQGEKASKE